MAFGIPPPPTPKDIAADIIRDFRSRYKYRILGKNDALFEKVARAVQHDQNLFDQVKRLRTRNMRAENIIRQSGYSEAVLREKLAVNRLDYLQKAVRLLEQNKDASQSTTLASAINTLSGELDRTLDGYILSKGGKANISPADNLVTDIRNLHRRLEKLEQYDRVRLRQENLFFYRDHFTATKNLAETRKALLDISV